MTNQSLHSAALSRNGEGNGGVIPQVQRSEIGSAFSRHYQTSSPSLSPSKDPQLDGTSTYQNLENPPTKLPTKLNSLEYDRKEKVAKTEYADHGTHGLVVPSLCENENTPNGNKHEAPGPSNNASLVKKMTCSLTQVYEENDFQHDSPSKPTASIVNDRSKPSPLSESQAGKKRVSPNSTNHNNQTPAPSGLGAALAVAENENKANVQPANISSNENYNAHQQSAPSSLLHVALQGSSDVSDQTNDINASSPSRGECLTNPNEKDSTNKQDNVEGNLIVYKNDLIRIPTHSLHMHKSKIDALHFVKSDNTGTTTSFQVLGLLGQGTFAQVFKCRNVATGQLVAVKIVKNKPAYTRQAATEIDIFQALEKEIPQDFPDHDSGRINSGSNKNMVELLCYFLHQSHLCLVFELHGLNLYEVLKRRQFRGLPINCVRDIVKQTLEGINELSQRKIVHCDMKPENILMASDKAVNEMIYAGESQSYGSSSQKQKEADYEPNLLGRIQQKAEKKIKLIDFGSACFVGQATHTYIQSRFYRSPEVLIGLDYDSAIDVWSVGCMAAELFLGLPILPGVHEHDQLSRIAEMIGKLPDWMIDQGTKASKNYHKKLSTDGNDLQKLSRKPKKLCWALKTREEFINSLSDEEKEQYGGAAKLEQQPANRYFKTKLLEDIVLLHGGSSTAEEKEELGLFIHFLKGILNPDPCERWTALQATMHPFMTGKATVRRKTVDKRIDEKGTKNTKEQKRSLWDIQWKPPFDPSICRRKLELQDNRRKSVRRRFSSFESSERIGHGDRRSIRQPDYLASPNTSRMTDLAGAMSISHPYHNSGNASPPSSIDNASSLSRHPQMGKIPYSIPSDLSSSLGGLHHQHAHSLRDFGHHTQHRTNLSYSHNQYSPSEASATHGHMNDNVNEHLLVPPPLPMTMGAQSFSGVYYDRMHNVPTESELGYALQRPGVVPDGKMAAHLGQYYLQSPNHMGQQKQQQPPAFLGRPASFSNSDAQHYMPPNGSSMPNSDAQNYMPPNGSSMPLGTSMPQMVAYHGGSVPLSPQQIRHDRDPMNNLTLDHPPQHFHQQSGGHNMYGSYNSRQNHYPHNHRGSM